MIVRFFLSIIIVIFLPTNLTTYFLGLCMLRKVKKVAFDYDFII